MQDDTRDDLMLAIADWIEELGNGRRCNRERLAVFASRVMALTAQAKYEQRLPAEAR